MVITDCLLSKSSLEDKYEISCQFSLINMNQSKSGDSYRRIGTELWLEDSKMMGKD